MKRHYLLFIEGDVEPRLIGPYGDSEARDRMAKAFRLRYGPAHGIFALDLDIESMGISVWAYSTKFFWEED